MHPLAAPGTLWVLSRVGKYLVRPQADETSHKKQISCGWQGKTLPCFSCNTEGFASAEATRGLSDRPLNPFGGHPFMRGRNLSQETDFLQKAGKGATFLFLHRKGFRLCGGDQGAFRSPPGPLRGPSLYAWVKSSTRNKFLVEGKAKAFLAFLRIADRITPKLLPTHSLIRSPCPGLLLNPPISRQ